MNHLNAISCESCGAFFMSPSNPTLCNACEQWEERKKAMPNFHNAQTDAWQHRNSDVDQGPLFGIVIHEPPKPSTRPRARLNHTTLALTALALFPLVYWVYGCAQ